MTEAYASAPPTVIMDHVQISFEVAVDGGKASDPGGKRPRTTTVHAVRSVSAVVHRGEAIGIIGRNGSGKSTLLRAVAGLVPVQSGQVWSSAPPTLLGVDAALLPKLSGERNIVLGLLALGVPRREIKEMTADIVEFSGLGEAIHRPMRTYSAGMGSRLRFAIATAKVPEILLIDEALNTGDAEFQRKSGTRLNAMRDQAGTVFLVSHSLATIKDTCSRVLWLDDGVLRMDAEAQTVIDAYLEYQTAFDAHLKQGGPPPGKPGALVGLDADLRPVRVGEAAAVTARTRPAAGRGRGTHRSLQRRGLRLGRPRRG